MAKTVVMVVDDSALVRQTFVSLLEESGNFEVITAVNPIFAQRKDPADDQSLLS